MTIPRKVAVIGAGSMGRNHLRVLRDLPDAQLVGVADVDADAARAAARHHAVPVYESHIRLLKEQAPDAVTIAVPTGLHHRVGLDAIAAGCHVMIEKPLASTIEPSSA